MKFLKPWTFFFVAAAVCLGRTEPSRQPIIDVHLHSASDSALNGDWPDPVPGISKPASAREHTQQTLAMMDRYNIVLGIASYDAENVERLRLAAPDRIWAGLSYGIPGFEIEKMRSLYKSGKLRIMGEVCAQYDGLSPSDSVLEPYFALAESLDVPACVHMGMSFSGITQSAPKFRVSMGNPLLLEEMLNRHPKLRVWIAHMGFPYLQETIGILSVYPQVSIDTSAIDWLASPEPFLSYLKELVKNGLGDRIMFGSDQMTWPDAIGIAIDWIEQADFLTAEQKRDILYNNAARFLRLTPEQIAKHHGTSNR
jgi:predicted TIM-barrel fold metal-dependent hydrolase